ncbi:MAG: crossover junction endodeoxyribonuclease RuvC, partial [Rhodospirillaceae bacterium]|nr:crossover junction endodeoxyribonuclease RuvC [Rhodospirillaceae bacterium]
MRIIGLDPGLRTTGWGIIDVDGPHLRHVAHGSVSSADDESLARRLVSLHDGLEKVIAQWTPGEAAVEETFV